MPNLRNLFRTRISLEEVFWHVRYETWVRLRNTSQRGTYPQNEILVNSLRWTQYYFWNIFGMWWNDRQYPASKLKLKLEASPFTFKLSINWIKKGINTKHVRVGQVATPGGMHPKVRSSGQNYKAEASQSNSFTLNHWPFLSTSVLLRMSLLWKTKEQYSLKNDPVRVLIVKKSLAILLPLTEKDKNQLMGNPQVLSGRKPTNQGLGWLFE